MKYPILLFTVLTATPLFADKSADKGTAAASPAKELAENSDYQVRGFFGTGKDLEISLAKKGAKTSEWMKIGRNTGDIFVESADPHKGFAVLQIKGVRTRVRVAAESAEIIDPEPYAVHVGKDGKEPSPEAIREIRRRHTAEEWQEIVSKFGGHLASMTQQQREMMKKEIKTAVTRNLGDILTKTANIDADSDGSSAEAQKQALREQAGTMVMQSLRQAVEKASALPDKNGVVTAPPPETYEFLSLTPDQMRAVGAEIRTVNKR